jgi:leucyl aminopeptidase (aminopeptidase T)
VKGARELRVRSEAGTDVALDVTGRSWVDDALPLEPGGIANCPGGEICMAPLPHAAHGSASIASSVSGIAATL